MVPRCIQQVLWVSLLPVLLLPMQMACKSTPDRSSDVAETTEARASEESESPIVTVQFKSEKVFTSPEARRIVKEFRELESQWQKAKDRVLLFAERGNAEESGPTALEPVKDADSWPDDTLRSYIILLGANREIRLLQIVPNSESGDWVEQEDHLVIGERIRYWERYFGTHNPDVPTKSWLAYAWTDTGKHLGKAALYVDHEGKPWKGDLPAEPPMPPLRLQQILDKHRLTEHLIRAKVRLSTKKAG